MNNNYLKIKNFFKKGIQTIVPLVGISLLAYTASNTISAEQIQKAELKNKKQISYFSKTPSKSFKNKNAEEDEYHSTNIMPTTKEKGDEYHSTNIMPTTKEEGDEYHSTDITQNMTDKSKITDNSSTNNQKSDKNEQKLKKQNEKELQEQQDKENEEMHRKETERIETETINQMNRDMQRQEEQEKLDKIVKEKEDQLNIIKKREEAKKEEAKNQERKKKENELKKKKTTKIINANLEKKVEDPFKKEEETTKIKKKIEQIKKTDKQLGKIIENYEQRNPPIKLRDVVRHNATKITDLGILTKTALYNQDEQNTKYANLEKKTNELHKKVDELKEYIVKLKNPVKTKIKEIKIDEEQSEDNKKNKKIKKKTAKVKKTYKKIIKTLKKVKQKVFSDFAKKTTLPKAYVGYKSNSATQWLGGPREKNGRNRVRTINIDGKRYLDLSLYIAEKNFKKLSPGTEIYVTIPGQGTYAMNDFTSYKRYSYSEFNKDLIPFPKGSEKKSLIFTSVTNKNGKRVRNAEFRKNIANLVKSTYNQIKSKSKKTSKQTKTRSVKKVVRKTSTNKNYTNQTNESEKLFNQYLKEQKKINENQTTLSNQVTSLSNQVTSLSGTATSLREEFQKLKNDYKNKFKPSESKIDATIKYKPSESKIDATIKYKPSESKINPTQTNKNIEEKIIKTTDDIIKYDPVKKKDPNSLYLHGRRIKWFRRPSKAISKEEKERLTNGLYENTKNPNNKPNPDNYGVDTAELTLSKQ